MTSVDPASESRAPRVAALLAKIALLALAWLAQPAMAVTFAQCASTEVVATNLPSVLAVAPGTAAGTALGPGNFTAAVTVRNCNGAAGSQFQLSVNFGSALTSTSAVGIDVRTTAAPSFTVSAGCPTPGLITATSYTLLTMVGASSNCTVTLMVSGRFFLGTNRIVGRQAIDRQLYGGGQYCLNAPTCDTARYVDTNSGATFSGVSQIPVYVAACAGVLTATQTVTLPPVTTAAFQANTNPVSKTPFQISLASCLDKPNNGAAGNVGYDAHILWLFTSCGSVTVMCSGGSSNVKLQILRADGATPVSSLVDDDSHVLVTGTNVFQYYAAYVNPGGGAVTPGTAAGMAQIFVFYE